MTNVERSRPPWWRKRKRRFTNPDAALDADKTRLSSYKRELAGLYASLASLRASRTGHAVIRQQEASIRRRIGAIKGKVAELKRSINARMSGNQQRTPYVAEPLSPTVAAIMNVVSPEEPVPIRWTGLDRNELIQE